MTDRPLLVIDTDPGTDDAVAFVVSGLLGDRFERAFVSTYGNMPLDVTHANMRKAISLAGLSGHVFRGSELPLVGEPLDCGGYHGVDGLGGVADLIEDTCPADEGSLDDLAEQICGASGCTYVAIGPLTNLATMLASKPQVANHIDRLLVMGGGFLQSNRPHGAEYNFAADPAADARVLASGLDITLFPLDLTQRYPLTPDAIEALPFGESTVLGQIIRANRDSAMAAGLGGAIIHDAMPVLYVVCPEAFELVGMTVSVDEWGRTAFDLGGAPMRVAVFARDGLLASALS